MNFHIYISKRKFTLHCESSGEHFPTPHIAKVRVYSLAFALADWLADRSVKFTHRKYHLSDAHRDFLREILTEITKNKFKMSWRPYGEPYPRTRVGRS